MARSRSTKRAQSYITGEKGTNRVRLYPHPRDGKLLLEYRDEVGTKRRVSLRHSDLVRGKEKADALAAELRKGPAPRGAEITLRSLIDMYESEVTPTKGDSGQAHDRRTFPLFLRAFGSTRPPASLNIRDWQTYIRLRQTGTLAPSGGKGKPVGNRILEQDLKLLLAILNWAERARGDGSAYLLDRNPLRGLKVPKEENPRRPQLSAEQFVAIRLAAKADSASAELFVMLAWYAGHRAQSVRRLRWSDLDLVAGTIRWRAENDKIRYEHVNPMHSELLAFLRAAHGARVTGDDWIFPELSGDDRRSRYRCVELFRRLARSAGVPSGEGFGWHACRRAFANTLRDVPLRDLKDLGGWKTSKTVVEVYLQPDQEAQRRALLLMGRNATDTTNGHQVAR